MEAKAFLLPGLAMGPADILRLRRELQALDDFLRQAAIRAGGTSVKMPRTSRLLEEVAKVNKLNLLHEADRKLLTGFLDQVRSKAPVVHISFASDPSAAFMAKIVVWLRENVHPLVLVQTGLQPTLAAGCVVRTPNRVFDFSLRRHFASQRGLLLEKMRAAPPAATQPAVHPTPTGQA